MPAESKGMSRREFLTHSAKVSAGIITAGSLVSCTTSSVSSNMTAAKGGFRRRGFIGSINYFADPSHGYDWWKCLVDEMVRHNANTLAVFCESSTGPDPRGFGLGWPCGVPGAHRDKNCINANPKTEYLTKIIEYCKEAGIKFKLEISTLDDWAFVAAHPELRQEISEGKYDRHLCPNKPQAMSYIRAKVVDLATFYPNAAAIIFDQHIKYAFYGYCKCPHCRSDFIKTMGIEPAKATDSQLLIYRYKVMVRLTRELMQAVKAKVPGMRVGTTLEGVSTEMMPERQKYYSQADTGLDFIFFQNLNRHRDNMNGVTQSVTSAYDEVWVACGVYTTKVLKYSEYFRGAGWWRPAVPDDAEIYVDMAIEAREQLSKPERFVGFTFWNISLHDKGDPMRKAAMRAIKRLSTYQPC